jgi:transposase
LYWQLTKLGVDCEVIAPSLIPKKAGDKIKTDRRDAERLAQSYQNGDLTPVWVPTSPGVAPSPVDFNVIGFLAWSDAADVS